jgi:exopolysaccharide biosynthesis polyprenyl glycosylphosphotransferase
VTEVNGAESRAFLGDHHTSSHNGFAADRVAGNGHALLRNGAAPVAASRPLWERRYGWVVAASDLVAMGLALGVGMYVGLGESEETPHLAEWTALIIAVGFAVAMMACRAWEARILGSGSEEYTRLLRGLLNSGVTLGMVGLAFRVESVRGWVFLVIPLAGVLAFAGRYLLRKPLYRRRERGQCLHQVLAIGSEEFIADLRLRTLRNPRHGWTLTAACTPGGAGRTVQGVPLVGDLDAASSVALSGDFGVVAVAAADGWTPKRLHQFSWDIEGCGADLVVHPGLMEVSGPRLHVAPVDGLPLLRLTEPTFTGIPRLVKSAMDVVGAALMLLILAPLMAVLFLLVRLDGGPALFRQTRVGKNGQTFKMLKFRTMVPDAERLRSSLLPANDGHGPLFKMREDPRITPVGSLLRRYSLDELPQFLNVLLGSMSLVGPRPPLPEEVDTYGRDANRKLLVKPGLTGLWQISGRSDLSWEESVRLDLRYVENWNLALDGLILWKTFKAVISGDGAY